MTNIELIGYMAKISINKTLRNKYAFLVELFEMAIFLIGIIALYTLQILPPEFLLSIMATMLIINAMGIGIKVGTSLIFYKDKGVLQEFYSSPATSTDKILGLIAEQTPALILKATIILLLIALVIEITIIQVIALYIIILLTAILTSLICIVISSKTNNLQLLGIIVYIIGLLQFGLNGLIVMAKDLPVTMINPYSYISDFFLHASLQAVPNYPLLADIIVTIAILAVTYRLAIVTINKIEIYG